MGRGWEGTAARKATALVVATKGRNRRTGGRGGGWIPDLTAGLSDSGAAEPLPERMVTGTAAD